MICFFFELFSSSSYFGEVNKIKKLQKQINAARGALSIWSKIMEFSVGRSIGKHFFGSKKSFENSRNEGEHLKMLSRFPDCPQAHKK